ncbi:MAG: GIY-YIG nuclease family protein [Pseudomonadota bacterium]
MEADANLRLTCGSVTLTKLPRCCGVYRFLNADARPLYIGKSIDLGARINSHFAQAKGTGRVRGMLQSVEGIDCELTAGELGALLIENAAIKAEAPLYNQAQKRSRRLWTQRLKRDARGFLQVQLSDFCPDSLAAESVYGLFRSQTHLKKTLRLLARDQKLCLRILGLERGTGTCFARQIGHCAGACIGAETPDEHNARLVRALEKQQIAAWPFSSQVILMERCDEKSHKLQPETQYHLVDRWVYLGTFATLADAQHAALHNTKLHFDRDTYHIVLRAMRLRQCGIISAIDGSELTNPMAVIDTDSNRAPVEALSG